MKARTIRVTMRANPLWRKDAAEAARLFNLHYSVPRYIECAAGTVIDDPKAYMLVRMGQAVPADEECAERCCRTPEQIEAAIKVQEKVSKGILPDDYHRYDRGEMTGYNPDGTDIKGPNWDEYNSETQDEEEDYDAGSDYDE